MRVTKRGRKARQESVARIDPGMKALIEVIGAHEFTRALPFLIKLRQVLDAARD